MEKSVKSLSVLRQAVQQLQALTAVPVDVEGVLEGRFGLSGVLPRHQQRVGV